MERARLGRKGLRARMVPPERPELKEQPELRDRLESRAALGHRVPRELRAQDRQALQDHKAHRERRVLLVAREAQARPVPRDRRDPPAR